MSTGEIGADVRLAGLTREPAAYSYATFFRDYYPIVLKFLD